MRKIIINFKKYLNLLKRVKLTILNKYNQIIKRNLDLLKLK